jgi:hypothetical protein
VKKFNIITSLGILSNLLNINIIRNIKIFAIRQALTKNHKSEIEKYFQDLLYTPNIKNIIGTSMQAKIVSIVKASK